IGMNPRVSRSSALASKATGFPIAKIAARPAIGYALDEIRNDITGQTPACFEPALDYVVVKVPRFAFEKFPGANPALTTHMKSVGEAMAIGRSFPEALGKALRSLESPGAPKRAGFSDAQIAEIAGITEDEVRRHRHELGIRPVFHTVDTCAAEFEARTPYLYSTYDEQSEVPAGDRPKVIILGSGPNRIG